MNKNVKNAKNGPSPHNWINSCNQKCAWAYSFMAAKVKAPRLSAVCKDESDHHLEHKELEWDQSDMIDLSDPQNDIEILEHKEPMAFAIPPVTDKLISAPLTVNQTAQGQETAALRT